MRRLKRDGGFTTAELCIVIMVIVILTIFLFPRMSALIADARYSEARQDAAAIGAAVEILKIEGLYDPDGDGLYALIVMESGREFLGTISDMEADGSFIYSHKSGDYICVVRYDSATGSVSDVKQ